MKRLRAVAHVHSDWSYDGTWSLDALAAAFRRRRYDLVFMSEHDRGFDEARWHEYGRACARASNERIRLVPGMEYSDPTNTVHVLVWGDLPFLGEGLETTTLLERVAEAGGTAVLAHPSRRKAWQLYEPGWTTLLTGVELWNRKYDGVAPSSHAIAILDGQPSLLPFVGLDFHTRRQFFPLALELPEDFAVGGSAEAVLRGGRDRPRAFGLDAARFTRGGAFSAVNVLERTRRRVAPYLRRGVRRPRRR